MEYQFCRLDILFFLSASGDEANQLAGRPSFPPVCLDSSFFSFFFTSCFMYVLKVVKFAWRE